MSNLMTTSTKEQLKEAIYDMTVLTDDGLHPSAALEKVASESDFTDDQIRLIARTFNTAVSLDKRKTGASLLSWLESNPIADAEAVIERRNKKASQKADVKIASVWDTPLDRRKTYQAPQLKVACLKVPERPQAEPAPVKVDRDSIERQMQTEECKLASLRTYFDSIASVLRNTVKEIPEYRQEALKYAAVSKYGKDIMPYFETVFLNPKTISIPKQASVVSDTDFVVDSLGRLKGCGDSIIRSLSAINKLAADGGYGASRSTFHSLNPVNVPLFALNTAVQKAKKSIPGRIEEMQKYKPPRSSAESLLGSQRLSFGIETPSETLKLKKIKLQALLNDLMYNDPIISEYDEDKIQEAFNEVSELAPHAAERPAMLRAMMREYLAKDGLGLYDLHGIIGDEKGILEAEARSRQTQQQERNSAYDRADTLRDLKNPKRQITQNIINNPPPKINVNNRNIIQSMPRPPRPPKTPDPSSPTTSP
jgi:hypothetical protein